MRRGDDRMANWSHEIETLDKAIVGPGALWNCPGICADDGAPMWNRAHPREFLKTCRVGDRRSEGMVKSHPDQILERHCGLEHRCMRPRRGPGVDRMRRGGRPTTG